MCTFIYGNYHRFPSSLLFQSLFFSIVIFPRLVAAFTPLFLSGYKKYFKFLFSFLCEIFCSQANIFPLSVVLLVSDELPLPSVYDDSWLWGHHHRPGGCFYLCILETTRIMGSAHVSVGTPPHILDLSQACPHPLVAPGPVMGKRHCSSPWTKA